MTLEKTKVGIVTVLISIPTLVYAIFWFAGVVAKGEAAEAKDIKQDAKIEAIMDSIQLIRESQIRMEILLGKHK